MKYNIYTEGNYFTIKSEVDEYFYGHRKDVIVDKDNIDLQNYRVFNVKDFSDKIILKIGSILKQDNSSYSQVEWETFYKENTGNFNGGGTAPNPTPINQNNKTKIYPILDNTFNFETTTSLDVKNGILSNYGILPIDEFTTPIFQLKDGKGNYQNWVSSFGKGDAQNFPNSSFQKFDTSAQFLITKTRSEVLALIASSSLVKGATYEITDCDAALYGGTTIYLQALSNNQFAESGFGKFYLPNLPLEDQLETLVKFTESNFVGERQLSYRESVTSNNGKTGVYLGEGLILVEGANDDWTSATSFTTSITSSTGDMSVIVQTNILPLNKKFIWGEKVWQSVSSLVQSQDEFTIASGAVLLDNITNPDKYYINYDEIKYSFADDMIFYRKNKNDNEVLFNVNDVVNGVLKNPIKNCKWGTHYIDLNNKNLFTSLSIKNSLVNNINSKRGFIQNVFNNYSFFEKNIFYSDDLPISGNVFDSVYFSNNTLVTFTNSNFKQGVLQSNRLNTFFGLDLGNAFEFKDNYITSPFDTLVIKNISQFYNNTLINCVLSGFNLVDNSSFRNNTHSADDVLTNVNIQDSCIIQNNTNLLIQSASFKNQCIISNNTKLNIKNCTLQSASINLILNTFFRREISNSSLFNMALSLASNELNNNMSYFNIIGAFLTTAFNTFLATSNSGVKTVFLREDGTPLLSYYDNTNTQIITPII